MTPEPVENEYYMPSIEQNGHQWIRLVDHVELCRREKQKLIEEILPFLRELKTILAKDHSIHPVQASPAIYQTPESVLRETANDIERKRGLENKLDDLLTKLRG